MHNGCSEHHPAQPIRDEKSGGDSDSLKECVNEQAPQRRVDDARVEECFVMGLLAEMEVGRPGVFKEVYDKVAEQDHDGSHFRGKLEASRDHLQDGRSQHEARTQGDEVGEERPAPGAGGDNQTAEYIGQGRDDAQRERDSQN